MIQIIDNPPSGSPEKRKPAMQTYSMPPRVWHDTSTQTDAEVFLHAFNVLIQTDEHASGKLISMGIWNLESLAHDRDYGVKLVQPEPLRHLLLLARTNVGWQIRQGAARVIGSSLWNNLEAMEAVKGSHLITTLVEILKAEKHTGVRASLIFAMSAAASVEDEMKEFMDSNGSQFLRDIFQKDEPEVKAKCATFVQDNLLWNRNLVRVDEELSRWCQIFQESLYQGTADIAAPKILESL